MGKAKGNTNEQAAPRRSATANERTVDMAPHYKKAKAQQHWDRMWDLYREAWCVGNITKYVERYREKNGLKDLYKARHYLDKLIELEEAELALEAERQRKANPDGGSDAQDEEVESDE